ncbi:hypothetical protein like AT1G76980 [Hibiscus trionum]|uniref:Uncharacterized protein n=1 Tax=Hibiscus trionum TaxID=183268 RepID=A0A9W7HUF3_HIBTR|nr:hypothetical protein like AT1G76980 [Hibiscus trionum]
MFDPAAKLPKSDFSLSKHMGKNYDSRVQKTAQSYRSWNTMGADGTSTPPLWGTNPSPSPPRGNNINYRCLSPSSKAQAIARGQRELMEMVSRMPESCFELTLKDLVEHRDAAVESKQESCAEGRGAFNEDEYSKEKKKNQKPQIKRSGSIDSGGFLLKMAFPFSLGSKSKNKKETKRNGSNVNYNSRVSPKPTVSDESGKGIDKEWWKKRSGSSESDSGGSNINIGSTKSSRSSSTGSSSSCGSVGNTSRRHTGNSCLAFIFNRKNKASQ